MRAFENLVLTKKAQMPLERTLLANGIMLAGLESRRKGGIMGRYAGACGLLFLAALAGAAEYTLVDVQECRSPATLPPRSCGPSCKSRFPKSGVTS